MNKHDLEGPGNVVWEAVETRVVENGTIMSPVWPSHPQSLERDWVSAVPCTSPPPWRYFSSLALVPARLHSLNTRAAHRLGAPEGEREGQGGVARMPYPGDAEPPSFLLGGWLRLSSAVHTPGGGPEPPS